jgi:hypothetical protein
MFKQNFLKMRTTSALKKNKVLRGTVPYKRAQFVGIIFSVEDKQKHEYVKEFVKHLEQDGKKVQVLEFLPKKKENYEFLFDFFSDKDLSFWGKIHSTQALKFSETQFDYLYYIDNELNPMVLNLLAQSKAHCRIGRFSEVDSAFFEFMISHQGNIKNLIDSMYAYSRQLR